MWVSAPFSDHPQNSYEARTSSPDGLFRGNTWQNPYVERFIGTLRRELLNHVIVLNERHLERLLGEFIEEYYHVARPHQGLGGDTPIATESPPDLDGPTTLVATPVLGGLHHRYERQAA